MKKLTALLLALAVSIPLSACAGSEPPAPPPAVESTNDSLLFFDSDPKPTPETPTPPAPTPPEEPEPEIISACSPADLHGVWLQVGSEVEGDINATMPAYFHALIFEADAAGQTLMASARAGDYYGFVDEDSYDDRQVTVLDEPLYEGCGNDVWSVRIGEQSPLNEHGYPAQTEIYVTLTDQNTLLQQHYFSFDGGPGVSYQTYRRFLPKAPGGMEEAALAGGVFELAGYIDADGVRHDEHPLYSGFRLHLKADGGYTFDASCAGESGGDCAGAGYDWSLGEGGTLLLRSEDTQNGFGGTAYWHDETQRIPELFLWDNMDGILCLKYVAWDDSGDTMTDLEGNAFAAPADALLVCYGDGYLDMDYYRSNEAIPFHALADGPDVHQILLSCVNDNTTLWLENDGFEVARLGTMMAGESVILQLGYPDSGGPLLFMEVGGEEYYIELSQSILPLDTWDYIVS